MTLQKRILAASLAAVFSMPAVQADHHMGEEKEFDIELMSLNSSGVEGKAEVKLKGKTLTISLQASGLETGKPHPQHLHGFDDASRHSSCPGIEADTDGDGLISIKEGVPAFGPILVPLAPFDLVDSNGKLSYEASFTVDPAKLQPLHKRAVVLHGMTVNGEYIASLPIACGLIKQDD